MTANTPELELPFDPLRQRIHSAFESQRVFAPSLRGSTASDRITKIRRLKTTFLASLNELRAAAQADFGKPSAEVDFWEATAVVAEANHVIRNLARWMRPRRVASTLALMGTSSQVRCEPRGVCLIVAPWNYPFNLSFVPLIDAIAAGNTVILKPSELAPHMSAVIAKIVRETFDEHEVAVFEGDAETAAALLELPFDHVFFTGSPRLGSVVMAAAARHLSSVTLELGGKSPAIVDESADLDHAVSRLLWGKFSNAGQTCFAPDYVLVHENVQEAFLARFKAAIERTYGQDAESRMASGDFARIVNDRHFLRLRSLLDDAKQRGARVIVGGELSSPDRYIGPTVIAGLSSDAAVMQEEIFGPLLPVQSFQHLDQAIAEINRRDKPLALYLFSKQRKRIGKVLTQTSAGGTCINGTGLQAMNPNLPFGGVNSSGIGAYHGIHGFRAFSHERSVIRVRFTSLDMFHPPYTNLVKRMIAFSMKWFV